VTGEEEGQAKYGSKFHNQTFFTKVHFFNAAFRDGDHIHEGAGFVAQHLKITNLFEEAIQAVDPSVYLPYWDFTIDSAQNLSIYESPMFTADTFGTLKRPYNESECWTYEHDSVEDGRISDGRWANLKAEKNVYYPDLMQGEIEIVVD